MRIEELTLQGFGKWDRATFSFGPGLNLIYADNEAGKSTLLEAIITILYGMKKDYLKKGVRREEWQRYLPWDGQQYSGTIRYRLGSQHYRIERDLLTENHLLFDAKVLRDLSKDYPMDGRKERNYLYEQIGLTRTLFEEVSRIKTIGIEHDQPMMESLHQLAGQDYEGPATYKEVFQLLEQKKREIGKGDMGKDTRLAIVQQQLTKAKQELDQARSRMKHFRELESEYRALTQKLSELDNRLETQTQGEHSREQLQQSREQALLTKQQFAHFLEDMAQLQVEEEMLVTKVQASSALSMDGLDTEIKQCEDQAAQVDAEITRYEQLLPYIHELQQVENQIKHTYKVKRPIRGIALLLALIGIGSLAFFPWYYGVGGITFALLLYSSTMQPSREKDLHRKKQELLKRLSISRDMDETKLRENLQQLIQQREVLYKQRLAFIHEKSMLREQEQIIQQLKHLSVRKQKLLFQLKPIREVDRAFVECWKRAYTYTDYDEEQMIEAWVHYLKKMDVEIAQQTDMLSKLNLHMQERDTILRSIAHVEGEMKNYDDLALTEKENRYARLVDERQVWERKRAIIDLAKGVFQETLDEWNQQIAPSLNARISEIFSTVTMGRYVRVSADPSHRFQLRVIEKERNAIRDQHQLSKGTEQQLYFSLRFALVELYSQSYRLPVFLDDSFVHYDQQRLEQAIVYLGEVSKRHQVFLFTCHAREQDLLESHGIPFQKVAL